MEKLKTLKNIKTFNKMTNNEGFVKVKFKKLNSLNIRLDHYEFNFDELYRRNFILCLKYLELFSKLKWDLKCWFMSQSNKKILLRQGRFFRRKSISVSCILLEFVSMRPLVINWLCIWSIRNKHELNADESLFSSLNLITGRCIS